MEQGILRSDIYKVLAAPSYHYNITMYDDDGAGTISPNEAKWFYIKPSNFMIQVPNNTDASIRPEVYLWKSIDVNDEKTKNVLQRLKQTANQYGHGFTIYDFGTGNLPKKFSHIAMRDIENSKVQESLSEGFTGSSMRSYFQLPKAKLIIVHSTKIDEEVRGSRTRNIKEIFVECNGERRRLLTNNIYAGKALARHLNEGGSWGDKFSNTINMYSSDLDSLKELLTDLQIKGRVTQAQRALSYIKQIKEYLKQASSPTGYNKCMDRIGEFPRVGNKYIEDYAMRVLPGCDSTQNTLSYARQHLISECMKLSEYRTVIENNLSYDVEPRDITKAAKRVCLAAVPISGDYILPSEKPSSETERVLLFGDSIVGVLDDEVLKDVLENICQKPHLTESDAKFILALGNSVLGRDRPKILIEPEIDQLKEWVDLKK